MYYDKMPLYDLRGKEVMTKRMIKGITLLLTGLWMIFIFWMSAASAEESTDMSLSVGYAVGRIVVDEFDSLSAEAQEEYAEQIDHPVRKTAHFMEYTVLGILFSVDLLLFIRLTVMSRFLLAWIAGIAYSITDEFHQLFVSGRSGQLTDVLIDGSGVLLGCIVILVVCMLYSFKRNKKVEKGREQF